MKNIKFTPVLLCLICANSLFSQRIEKPDKISPSAFVTTGETVNNVLFQRFLVTFPFKEDRLRAGAYDDLFELTIESYMRIFFKKGSYDESILLLPDIYESELNIKSIFYYYFQNNKIETRKLNKVEMHILKNDSLSFIDLSNLIKDSLVIIDLSYSLNTKRKKDIVLFFDKYKVYNDLEILIDFPEIYSYDVLFCDKNLTVASEDKSGQVMGYTAPSIPGCPLTPKYFAEANKRDYPDLNYYPVSFKIKSTTYTLRDNHINFTGRNNNEILNLHLFNIKNIK